MIVEMLDGENDLRCVEPASIEESRKVSYRQRRKRVIENKQANLSESMYVLLIFIEPFIATEDAEEFPARTEFKREEELLSVLERIVELHDERVRRDAS